MKRLAFSLLLASVVLAGTARLSDAQDQPVQNTPASFGQNSCSRDNLEGNRAASFRRIVPDILCDQKTIWTSPLHLGHDRAWIPAAAVVGTTVGLVLLDPSATPYFRRTPVFNGLDADLSGRHTAIGEVLFPVSLYAVSWLRHDAYGQRTALLIGESLADAELVSVVAKNVTRRLQPTDIPPHGNFSDTWFKKWNGGFPSGHTVAAFSIATTVSRRYKSHKWVPYVAYGAATVLAFSRITTSAHFPSDVFLGAALGYCVSRFVVLR